jgi:hypothetical protein
MVFLNLELRLYGLKRISGKLGGRIGHIPSFLAKMETKKTVSGSYLPVLCDSPFPGSIKTL